MAEEKFLTRWSRRKRSAARDAPSRAAADAATPPAASEKLVQPAPEATPEIVAGLPPIDAIDGSTDIRDFLAAGVPTALARAALRRAWASDPAIRDFVGLAENAWDFNAPDQLPGFGPVSADDVRRLLAQAVQPGSASLEAPSPAAPAGETSAKEGTKDERFPEPEPLKDEHRPAVAQSGPTEAAPSPRWVSRHGGALPK